MRDLSIAFLPSAFIIPTQQTICPPQLLRISATTLGTEVSALGEGKEHARSHEA